MKIARNVIVLTCVKPYKLYNLTISPPLFSLTSTSTWPEPCRFRFTIMFYIRRKIVAAVAALVAVAAAAMVAATPRHAMASRLPMRLPRLALALLLPRPLPPAARWPLFDWLLSRGIWNVR